MVFVRRHPLSASSASIPDPSSWVSLRAAAARRSGHQAVVVEDPDSLGGGPFGSAFVGAMSLGIDVADGRLRLASVGAAIRQDLVLISSDGTQVTWQQTCTRRGDAVEVELVRLDPDSERGMGRGALHFRNFLLWCEEAGIARVTLDAGKSIGGYFWARCGFLPDDASWRRLCRVWRQRAGRSGIDDLRVLLDKAEAAGPKGLVYLTNSIFGKSLLLHAQWHGLLDLTNPEQRDRARHYGHPSSR